MKNDVEISKINSKDLDLIAKLWINSFDYNFYSLLGKKITIDYLKMIISHEGNYIFKITRDNILRGFVIYANDKIINKKLVKKNIFMIFFVLSKMFFSLKIFKILFILKMILYLFKKDNHNFKIQYEIELVVICINKLERDLGLGNKLFKYTINEIFKNTKINKIYAKTAFPSLKTEIFYFNSGFKFFKKTFYGKWQILLLEKKEYEAN